MTPENSMLIATIACGLSSVCVVLSLWNVTRLASVDARLKDVDTKLPANRAAELEQGFDAMVQAFEGLQQKNAEFKQSVHNSVNRLDQVMRRNEKAVTLLDGNGNLSETLPDFVPAEDPTQQETDAVATNKQAALRARYNRNRGVKA